MSLTTTSQAYFSTRPKTASAIVSVPAGALVGYVARGAGVSLLGASFGGLGVAAAMFYGVSKYLTAKAASTNVANFKVAK